MAGWVAVWVNRGGRGGGCLGDGREEIDGGFEASAAARGLLRRMRRMQRALSPVPMKIMDGWLRAATRKSARTCTGVSLKVFHCVKPEDFSRLHRSHTAEVAGGP